MEKKTPTSVLLIRFAAIEVNNEGGRDTEADILGAPGAAVVLVTPPGVWVSPSVEKVFPSMVRFLSGS